MLKKKGFVLLGSAAVLAAGILAGCGGTTENVTTSNTGDKNLTVEDLAKDVSEKLEDIKSYSFNTATKIDYGISAEGKSLEMKMDGIMEGEAVTDSKEAHIKMNYNATALGQDMKMENEAYAVVDDNDKYITYSKTNSNGEAGKWKKNESSTQIDLDSMKNADIYKQIADGKIKAVLSEGNEKVNGKDVYKIEATIPGELFEEVYSNVYGGADTTDAFSGADFSQINAKTDLYIYKDNHLPARTYMDIREYGESLMTQAMSSATSQNYTINFGDFYVDMTMDDYNKINDIVIPDEVLKEAGE